MNQLVRDKVVNISRNEKSNVVLIEKPTLILSRAEYLVIENQQSSLAINDEQIAVIVEPGEYHVNEDEDDDVGFQLYPIEGEPYSFDGNFVVNLKDCRAAVTLLNMEVPLFMLAGKIITMGKSETRDEKYTTREVLAKIGEIELCACSVSTVDKTAEKYDSLIIGAGPYGTSAAVSSKANNINSYWVGEPLSFWLRNVQPTHLRSVKAATNIYAGCPGYTFIDFCNKYDISHSGKIRFWQFLAYYFYLINEFEVFPAQEKVIAVDHKDGNWVVRLSGIGGEKTVTAKNIINATGIGMHPNIPPMLVNLPEKLACHVSRSAVQAFPENRNIAVIGGAQSALEYALEADVRGNNVTLYVRDQLMYRNLHEPNQLIYRFLATNCEKIIGYLPVRLKARLLAYLLEGTCEPQVSEEVANSHINVKENVEIGACYQINDQMVSVISGDGERHFDRVVAATGYHYDVHDIDYLAPWLNESKHIIDGRFPNLDNNLMLKNAPPGMYFTGYSCIYAIGFKAQFINGSNIIVKRIVNNIKRSL